MAGLDAKQLAELEKPLDKRHISQRVKSGVQLSYIEGHHAIREANAIFGFDSWSRETMEMRLVSERERTIGKAQKPGWGVSYTAKVRVTVNGVSRDGFGAGHGIDTDLGQAHESAVKEAETDAMKRALMTFGDRFGLALYDKEQTHVVDSEAKERAAQEAAAKRLKAEEWADGFLKALMGCSAQEGEALRARNAAALSKMQRDHADLHQRIDDAIGSLPESGDEEPPQQPFGRVNGEHHEEANG